MLWFTLMSGAPLRPTPVPNVDWRTLPIGPTEAFVLSQVDGNSDPEQLALFTGLPKADVEAILDKLESLGALRFRGSEITSPPITEKSKQVDQPPESMGRMGVANTMPAPAEAPLFDPALLASPSELDEDTKRKVLVLEARLPSLTHYQLLGVDPTAEKKDIKAAYFGLINQFHTDRHFGKNLGIFKSRMEHLTRALTKAHDTLTRAKLRAEYDAYLGSRQATRGVRDSLPPSGVPEPGTLGPTSLTPSIPKAPRSPSFGPELSSGPAQSVQGPVSVIAPTSVDPMTQRRLLARRLGVRGPDDLISSAPPPPGEDPAATKDRIARELRDRFDARRGDPRAKARQYVALAATSTQQKQWGSAVNALRVASTLDPESAEIAQLLADASKTADRELAGQFADQAKYEQRDGHYDRATRSYERAARGKESGGELEEAGRLFHEAAVCAAKDGAEPKRIADLARRAVLAFGRKAEYRVSLAKAYEQLGLRSSAIGELQRALELEPEHEPAKTLLKQLR